MKPYRKKLLLVLSIIILIISFSFCNDNSVGPGNINPDIIKIKDCCNEIVGGNYVMNIWTGNKNIFTVAPPRYIILDNNLSFSKDTVFKQLYINDSFSYLFINKSILATRVVMVFSQFTDVSLGSLYELNLDSFNTTLLKDSTYNISSSVYFKTKPEECIYYSYGNPSKNLQPGYYWLNTITGQDSLIFSFLSELKNNAPAETVNGFDISPDDSKLLIPLHRPQLTALAAIYDLKTQKLDTLNINFNQQFVWLRFSHNGNQILYGTYPWGILSGNVSSGATEIGIITIPGLSERILNVNTNQNGASISIFPDWSPDDKNIVFGSARGPASEPPGTVGFFSLYILKDIN